MIELLGAEISVIGLVLAVVFNTILGMIWFNPKVFGNYWMGLIGKKIEDLESSPLDYILSMIKALVTAIALALFISYTGQNVEELDNVVLTLFVAIISWFGFIAMGSLNPVIWGGEVKNYIYLICPMN